MTCSDRSYGPDLARSIFQDGSFRSFPELR